MPKLILQYEGRVLKEYAVGQVVTIGRLPGNAIVIDNPAVSSKHARIVREGESYVIEDAESTNGTFVNELRVTRHPLTYGDLVLIGKHHLVFEETAGEDTLPPEEQPREIADLGGTVYLDTKRQKELLAQAQAKQAAVASPAAATVAPASHAAPVARVAAPAAAVSAAPALASAVPAPASAAATTASAVPAPASTAATTASAVPARASAVAATASAAPAPAPETARMSKAPSASAPSPTTVGVLYVLAGKTDQIEYPLKAQTCLIGKSDSAMVRLRGWFKPKTALAIARKGNGYTATPLGGKNMINNQPFSSRQDLRDGDVLQVCGVTLEFRLME
jgi:pSer/pThr/pTyr-binding forkhead associated (FHA) protein